MPAAQVPRKLTFLYLANDVIQNSKRKGPEFTQDFAPVIVDAFKHVYRSVGDRMYSDSGVVCLRSKWWIDDCIRLCLPFRDGEENCRKQLGRVLSIWQERAVYDSNLLDQLSQVLCKFPLRTGTRAFWLHHSVSNTTWKWLLKPKGSKRFPLRFFKCLFANRWREEG